MYSYILKQYDEEQQQLQREQQSQKTPTKLINYPQIKPSIINTNVAGFATIMSINLEYVNKLNRCKDRISKFNGNEWEELKKISNPYEHIYIFNGKNQYNGISKIKPLSRSFFKMIEIGNEYLKDIFIGELPLKTLHLAEGPGGFIEAVNYLRGEKAKRDEYFGITLIDKNKMVPCWTQSKQFLAVNPQVKILYGVDETGNLYNPENILSLRDSLGGNNMCDLITGDGGFDFSVNYNFQEQASSKLIFSQIVCALRYLSVGDDKVFICKIFDMSNYLTVELIYLVTLFFKTVVLYKPVTSRVANSEKYLVCRGYIGCDEEYWESLLNILTYWNKIEREIDEHKHKNTINFIFESIPSQFVLMVKDLNIKIIDMQIESINSTIDINKSGALKNYAWCEKNRKMQIEKAREWCVKNGIPFS